ncbi:MAG: RagB/SusD family nutrient uptake outer membrane protein [Pedobacter sp.]|nr:MAG: RagB/SusD family nutrient uptake outer membrane protein [Pedobacter sp.]
MKLNKISFIISGAIIMLVAPSCKKYLDQAPDNRAEINTVDKVAQLVSTAYPTYDYLTFTEFSSDNAEDKGVGIGSTDDVVDLPYAWRDVIGDGTNTSTQYWNGCYEAIAAANQALEAIENQDLGPAVLKYKGEALVARAYAHFMLVTLFAKTYEKGGANNSPGIPYITAPETKVIVQYQRGTVQSTYDAIEKDLLEGLKLVSASGYTAPKFHFTPAAANAFAARFYLFKGDWQKVVDYATLTVPGNDFINNIRPISSTIRTYTAEEHRTNYMTSGQKYNLLLINCYSTYARFSTPRHGFGVNNLKMFSAAGNVTGKGLANQNLSYGVPNYTAYKFKEFFFYTGPGIGYPYLTFAGFTTDEALLNRAEAYAELGMTALAYKDLNDLYSTRITNYNPTNDVITPAKIAAFYPSITDPKEGLIRAILDAKKSQFLQEGLRWFDILRRKITVVHNNFDAVGLETFAELKADDPRRVFQLPLEVKLSGLELNPR